MNSIHTNAGAKLALQTLRAVNAELAVTQKQLTTGLRVAKADDNPGTWAVAQGLRADLGGYRRVQESLTLGDTTLSIARQGAERIVDLLGRVREHVTAAQGENVDRTKLQTDIEALTEQIDSIVDLAAFSGVNLLSNRGAEAGSGMFEVKSSFTRDGDRFDWDPIDIRQRDRSSTASVVAAPGGTYAADAATATLTGPGSATLDASALAVTAGTAFSLTVFGTDADGSSFDQADWRSTAAATETQAEMAAGPLTYVARDGETMRDVLTHLSRKFDAWKGENDLEAGLLTLHVSGDKLVVESAADAGDDFALAINRLDADAGNTIGGELEELGRMDVTTADGARAALARIEGLTDTAIDIASSFGSGQKRMDVQRDFLKGLTDQITKGIGILVDTDMEETTARYQALLVQRDLAAQALSISNAAPQAVLSLFR